MSDDIFYPFRGNTWRWDVNTLSWVPWDGAVTGGGGGGGGTVDQGTGGASAWLVTGPLTDAQLRAAPVPVSASNLDVRDLATGQDKVDVRLRNAADSAFVEPATDRATAGAPFATRLSDGSAFYKATTPTDTQPVSAASLPLPTGAATAANQATANASLASIDGKLANPLPVTGPLTDAQLRASAVPVSASSLPLPSGAATESTLQDVLVALGGEAPAAETAGDDWVETTYEKYMRQMQEELLCELRELRAANVALLGHRSSMRDYTGGSL